MGALEHLLIANFRKVLIPFLWEKKKKKAVKKISYFLFFHKNLLKIFLIQIKCHS